MLQMTHQAAETLNRAREQEGLPEHFGVRIFAAPGPDNNSNAAGKSMFGFGFVDGPQDGDKVGETDGTNYYVAPEVAESLNDVVLDVADTGNLVLTRGGTA
jgi:Fe-S cluster assembly iron-binding protein IscA